MAYETPKARNLARLDSLNIITDDKGDIARVLVSAELNYGTFGRTVNVDLWPELTATQKAAIKTLWDKAVSVIKSKHVAAEV